MAVSIAAPAAGLRSRERTWPALVEAALVAAAIAALVPVWSALDTHEQGRDARFAPAAVVVRDLPAPVLRDVCATHGGGSDPEVRDRLCGPGAAAADPSRVDRLPRALTSAIALASRALVAPRDELRARIAELRGQRSGEAADPAALDRAIADELARLARYVRRYDLDAKGDDPPRALDCAVEALRAAGGGPALREGAEGRARANAALLFAAALDAHAAASSLIGAAALPAARATASRCDGVDARSSLAGVAALMADARASSGQRAKDEAMRALLHTARWQWAGWAVLGLLLLHVQRLGLAPVASTGVTLAAWAAAAWIGRVPWPLGSGAALSFARDTALPFGMPAGYVMAMLAVAALALCVAPWMAARLPGARSVAASPFAYPGWVVATGVGFLLLCDLSANGTFANRYLALYHHGHLWLAMLAFSLVAAWRQPLARGSSWMIALGDGAASRVVLRLGPVVAGGAFVVVALAGVTAAALLLANTRQLTSELGRLWLVTGAAWFFFLRGTPFTERVARSGGSFASLTRYLAPLMFVVVVLVAAMVLTRDMGPLLVAAYGAGAFVAASVAMWWYQRHATRLTAYAVAVLLFAAWIVATTVALYRFGALDPVTAARLENVAAPLASANDQLALVTWFQRAAPPAGFGPGAVPWCGFGATDTCAGVPAQIQSDYTFTALVGMFGWAGAWMLTLGCTLWLVATIRPHGRATRGEPRLVRVGTRLRNDEQAFLSWLCVAWVVMTLCQLAVTVAGNLAVIPLTGVTFPFVSFGMTSLTVNAAMLALAVDVAPRGPAQ